MKAIRLLLLLSLVTLGALSGCATNPVTGEQDFVLMSKSQEIALGQQYHLEIVKQYPPYTDDKLQDYVNGIGQQLATHSHRPGLGYRFTVLDDDSVNAFALPGGYVYIHRGILSYFNSEAELAAVLGHELGHVTARHSVRQHSTATLTGILTSVVAAQTGSRAAADLSNLLGTALVRGYGREHELEADRLGAQYLARSGYDPEAMLDVLTLLKEQETFDAKVARLEGREPRGYSGVLATHPSNDKRLQELVRAAKPQQAEGAGKNGRERYLRMIDGMTYGPSAEQGVLRGNSFYHRDLDFALGLPQDWKVDNRPDRLLVVAPQQAALMQLTLEELNKARPPQEVLRDVLEVDDLHQGRSLSIDGLPAYTALARGNTPFGTRAVRYTVIVRDRQAFVLAGTVKESGQLSRFDGAFLDTARSFHRLREEEQQLAKSMRLRIITAQPGDTFDKLAKNSPIAYYAADQLRLLNGLYPDGEPRPGQLIKIVE